MVSLAFRDKDAGTGGSTGAMNGGGFGHLIPAGEGVGSAVLGVIYDSMVFPVQVSRWEQGNPCVAA